MQSRDPFKDAYPVDILSLRTKDQTTLVASERLFARADNPAKMLRAYRPGLSSALDSIRSVSIAPRRGLFVESSAADLIDKFHRTGCPIEIDLLIGPSRGVGHKDRQPGS